MWSYEPEEALTRWQEAFTLEFMNKLCSGEQQTYLIYGRGRVQVPQLV